MNPLVAAALVSGGSNIVGGYFQREAQEDANAANLQAQREFAQMGIRWRVEDAKAAGLHPLYALGGAGATFTPSAQVLDYSDIGRAGQDVSRAIMAQETEQERSIRMATLATNAAAVEKDHAMAEYYRSLAAKTDQERNGAQSFPMGSVPGTPLVEVLPAQQTSRSRYDSSRTASSEPVWQQYEVAPGQFVYAPRAANPSEVRVPWYMYPEFFRRNQDYFTPNFPEKKTRSGFGSGLWR